MSKRVVLILIVVINLGLVWFLLKRELPPPPPAEPDLTGAAPAQRARIDRYIGKVQGKSLEELIDGLNEYEEQLAFSEIFSQDGQPELTFETCLANRRLAAIYEKLIDRPKDEAASISEGLFANKLDTLKADWERVFARWEIDGNNKEPIPLIENYRATSAALFLISAFCDSQTLIEAVDRWDLVFEEVTARIESDDRLKPLAGEAEERAGAELLFVLNLYLWHLKEEYKISPESALAGLTRRPMSSRVIPFIGWDGHTNASDFTHVIEDVQIDSKRILRTFQVFRSWYSATINNRPEKLAVVSAVREKLETAMRN